MKIVKILNSNAVVCIEADNSMEKIAVGQNIGLNQKMGDSVDQTKMQRVFELSNLEASIEFQNFIQEVPAEDILLADKVITYAKSHFSRFIDDTIYMSLTDHLSGSLERARNHIMIPNPLVPEMKSFYPEEFKISLEMLEIIQKETSIDFPQDEAAFIAMHIVSAELGIKISYFSDIIAFIADIVERVKCYLAKPVDETFIGWQKFIIHLSFLAQRIISSSGFIDRESILSQGFDNGNPEAEECVNALINYMREQYDYEVTPDERICLLIHMNFLQNEFGINRP